MQKDIIKILLANDHMLLRNGIIKVFKKHAPHLQIVGEAANFQEILILLSQIKADILMTDDAMPGRDLLIILPLIKERYPELKIIINSMLNATDNEESKKIMEMANGWVCFNSSEEEFIKVVEAVYDGSDLN